MSPGAQIGDLQLDYQSNYNFMVANELMSYLRLCSAIFFLNFMW